MDAFSALLRTLSVPQLKAVKSAIIDKPNKIFHNDPDAQFKINAID